MKKANTLELSVLRLDDNNHRAVLWDGVLTRHIDSVVFAVTFTHPNLFRAVRDIKQAVLDWNHSSGKIISGIHDGTSCWPIDTQIPIEMALSETDHLCLQPRALGFCPVILADFGIAAHLYTSTTRFSLKSSREKAGYPVETIGNNLFLVAESLLQLGREALEFQGFVGIAGIHDERPCWPEQF